jgi:branched-chain amino acid transport system substrate-binding protein
MQALQQEGALTSAHVVTGLANIVTYPFYGSVGTSFNYLSLYVSNGSTNKPNEYLIKAMEQKYHQQPDLFTPDGFVWAQMLVRAIQTGGGTNVNAMIKGLAGWSFLAPKGEQTIRARTTQCFSRCTRCLGSDDQRWLQARRAAHFECSVTAPPVTAHFNN